MFNHHTKHNQGEIIMTNNNGSTKKRKFKHLNYEKRGIIERLLKKGTPKTEIAEILGISRSTLYEEIKRGTAGQPRSGLTTYKIYYADAGQRIYEENRKNSRKPYKLSKAAGFIDYAEKEILENKKTPDVICGRVKTTGEFKEIVYAKTLYNYIDKGLIKVKNIDLPLRVKINKKVRKVRKNRRILEESIETRPKIINERKEFGHWEIDTVTGKRNESAVLLTPDKRLARKRIIVKTENKTTQAVTKGLK